MQKINDRIVIGNKIFSQITSLVNFTKYTTALIVADSNLPKSLIKKLETALPFKVSTVFLKGSEQHKNLSGVQKIWRALKNSGCDRKSLVINIGGGVIGDIGGFAASTFMRGIDFLQIPTTLLSQVDASIGGKVGINLLGIKNLVGSFQQPIAVIIDIDTLTTLPKREFISGFAEIIKHGLIADKNFFQFVTSKKPQGYSHKELIEIIGKSCLIKTNIVMQDEKETGVRKILNFGHTIGHAIESLSQKTSAPLLHGEAVSIGMILEGKISNLSGLLSDKEYRILEQSLVNAGLPVKRPGVNLKYILNKIRADKKNEAGQTNWTLLESIGKAMINQKPDEQTIKNVL